MKKVLKLTVVLFLICAIVAAVLGEVNAVTIGPITTRQKEKTESAYKAVLPEGDSFTELESIERNVRNKLKVILGLDAKVKLESPNTLTRFEGKAKRVKDLRKN